MQLNLVNHATPIRQEPTQSSSDSATQSAYGNKRKNGSPIHNYASEIQEGNSVYYKCNFCHVKYKKSGGTRTMMDHLRDSHSDLVGDSIDTKKRKLEDEKTLSDELLCMALITDNLPFRFVENEYFIEWLLRVAPNYNLPSRQSLADKVLELLYNRERNRIMSELEKASSVSLTTDGWVSQKKFNYIGVTCHLINDDFELKSYVLSIKHVIDKTADAL